MYTAEKVVVPVITTTTTASSSTSSSTQSFVVGAEDRFRLSKVNVIKDINGVDCSIPTVVCTETLTRLNKVLADLQAQVVDVQDKIAAITLTQESASGLDETVGGTTQSLGV